MNFVWILTESVNDYNQYGEYVRAIWFNKPRMDDLVDVQETTCNTFLSDFELKKLVEEGEVIDSYNNTLTLSCVKNSGAFMEVPHGKN